MKIVFRADAASQIGTGHIMRCLTLANALHERGAECRFVCREHCGNLIGLIRDNGFVVLTLPLQAEDMQAANSGDESAPAHANWVGADWKSDAQATCALLGDVKVDWLIVDHYGLDVRWESALRPYCRKLLVIDDLADRQHDCDLLLDQNLVADMAHRYDDRVPETCGRMLGPDYALLQPQYAHLHPRTPTRQGFVRRVLVYFGGADASNLTGLAIAAFLSLDRNDIAMDVVVNTAGPNYDEIREQVAGQQNLRLHAGLPTLAPLMVKADLAIGGGGATSWERCCLGLPALVITLAENQRPVASELDRHALIRWLGHHDEVSEEELANALRDVLGAGSIATWSERCQQVLDGRGADRVCDHLLVQAECLLVARRARAEDEEMLLGWANDPLVRQNSYSTGAIDPDTHKNWFRKRLGDFDHCRIYIVETENGLSIGQVRFERSGSNWEIDYSLDARFRGRKLGESLLLSAIKALRTDLNDSVTLVGQVKLSNTASRRSFERLGFEVKEQTASNVNYRLVYE